MRCTSCVPRDESALQKIDKDFHTVFHKHLFFILIPLLGTVDGIIRTVRGRTMGVLVKSRKGIIDFGVGLPDDEVRYLCALVQRALLTTA